MTNSVIYLNKLVNGGMARCETRLKQKKKIIIQEKLNICLKITLPKTLLVVHESAIGL
jgi:hypothetical protein